MMSDGDKPSMYFQIFSTVLDRDRLAPVWKTIESVFPGALWFGHSTSGNIVDCDVSPDITVSVTVFEKSSSKFELLQYDLKKTCIDDIASDLVTQANSGTWIKALEMYHTIANFSTTKFCEGMKPLRPDIQMFGGIVCSTDLSSSDSCVFSSVGGFSNSGLLVLMIGGEDFFVESFKISGWKPIGRNFHVTRASGQTLYEMGGVPAYEIYRKYLNINNDEHFFENALEFPVLYEHNGTTIVRAPAASNPDGSLTMSSDVEVGSIIRLSYGEPMTIVESIRQESDRIKSFNPDTLHIFSCAARKAFWASQEPTYEIFPFKNIAGSTGFFSHGEFLREKGHLNQHNITLVIAAMREGYGKGLQASAYQKKNVSMTKLPLAARMATFIRETSFELEEINSKLQVYNHQLKGLASTDSLTGLENRLSFDNLLKKIEADHNPLSEWVMLMIDVNGLKYTNDTFGHLAGDALIIAAAQTISDAFGASGHCFRIGGDEFVVLVDASLDKMYKLQNNLKRGIEEYNKTALYHLSVAVGESRLKNEFGTRKSISDWKMDADLNMYRDKSATHQTREFGDNQNLRELVSCLISIEEAKDSYTAHHSDRVQELSCKIAELLGLSESSLKLISDAALLHDIGKVGVSDAILGKPAKLTDEEFAVIKQHPVIGARILMQSNHTQELVQVVLHHHERYDGRGYPEGLSGDEIPVGARVIAIADSIDAMTSRRCYRDAMSLDFCREEIEKNLGKMYDPAMGQVVLDHWSEIVDTLLAMLSGSGKRS
ncbi:MULTISPECIES: HD domain-containing phosphohydrolase [unclassified Fibrobacter]|uniref:HD domain-containing phosphohydrolase n=1 Tax=unclassified Fibrobacter TaxID=2634177 RepID=UPI000D6AD13E|nr:MULTISPECIES: HD domain-containing phosphohydrolase [unclassified Fibrobacter]